MAQFLFDLSNYSLLVWSEAKQFLDASRVLSNADRIIRSEVDEIEYTYRCITHCSNGVGIPLLMYPLGGILVTLWV